MENNNPESKEGLLSYISVIAIAIVIAIFLRTFIFSSNLVKGESMQPTFEENDRLIALKFPLFFTDPKKGDVVIVQSPFEKKQYIKRVVGNPGDDIELHDGHFYINGELYKENYIQNGLETLAEDENHWILDDDEFFVVGDNRLPGASMDSRYFGPIEKKAVNGIVKFRFWPINKIGII